MSHHEETYRCPICETSRTFTEYDDEAEWTCSVCRSELYFVEAHFAVRNIGPDPEVFIARKRGAAHDEYQKGLSELQLKRANRLAEIDQIARKAGLE